MCLCRYQVILLGKVRDIHILIDRLSNSPKNFIRKKILSNKQNILFKNSICLNVSMASEISEYSHNKEFEYLSNRVFIYLPY